MPNEQFSNKLINILKASLPFLPGTAQRFFSYYIKIEEFNILCNNLDEEIDNDIRACANDNSPNPNDLLNAIKPYLNNSERELADMFMNMTRALNMYTAYKSLPNLYNGKSEEASNITEERYGAETYNDNGNYNSANAVFNNAVNSIFNSNNNGSNNTGVNTGINTGINAGSNADNNSDNFNSNSNSGSNNGLNNINIDMLKNMLSPSQRAMFDTYSSMLNK